MSSHTRVDVVVVGSGIGALLAAAHLAVAGKSVVVIEQHDIAGGNCTVFRRGEYEFDVGLHYIGDCGPGGVISSLLAGVGLADRLNFTPMDQDGFDTLRFPDLEFRVPADRVEYAQRIADVIPDDTEAIKACIDILDRVAQEARMNSFPGVDTSTLDEWKHRSLADLYDHCGLSQEAAALLSHWSGLYGSGPKETAVPIHAMLIDHYMRGAYYVEGGGQMIPARLVEVIEAHGGDVRTLTRCAEITVADGRVTGVRTQAGDTITAPVVISNGDYRRTVTELVGEEHWKSETVAATKHAKMTLALVCTYIVVDKLLDGPNTNYFVYPNWDTTGVFDSLEVGEFPETDLPFAYIAMASRKDPDNTDLCPPGHTNFQVMTMAPRGYGWLGVEDGPASGARYRRHETYLEAKADVEGRMVAAAESVFGPLANHIVHIETATPLTHERYTLSSEGTSYGLQHSPEQSGGRRPGHATEIPGLYLTGANTVSGHGIAGSLVGGALCAGLILGQDLMVESMMGDVKVDPAKLPVDGDDWEAMEVSRGAALRAKRAAGRAARAAASKA